MRGREPVDDVLGGVGDRQRVLGLEDATESRHERREVARAEEARLVLEERGPVATHHARGQRVGVRVGHDEERRRRQRLDELTEHDARIAAALEELVEEHDLRGAREQRLRPPHVGRRRHLRERRVVDLRDLEPDPPRLRQALEVAQEPPEKERPLERRCR